MTSIQGPIGLSRDELALLAPEYLLAGHLIDRAGMPHVIGAFGREAMGDIAIAEWMGASPVYTRRMQRALGFEGDSVETIFKGMQIDIGAPPQFMDFRFAVRDDHYGEFWLDHCGALMDVEPMGAEFVVTMCHDIEDPTFDATAIATNPRAQVRPIHRPPRVPADRSPHCRWMVTIAEDHPVLPTPVEAEAMAATRAATIELAPVDPDDPGRHHYSGPLLSDLQFSAWSASALRRIIDEVCLQGHLLALSFLAAIASRAGSAEAASELSRRQFTGVAGVSAERLGNALGLPPTLAGAARMLALHPGLQPYDYVGCDITLDDRLIVRLNRESAATADGAWPAMLDGDHLAPLDAMVRAIDPRLRCEAVSDGDALVVEVVRGDDETPESDDVVLTRFSTGVAHRFEPRGTPVEIRPSGSVTG
ncbi:MAG TPA: hypothetical protein VHU85_07805 [Acidimicrobiales bacterium]|jgi:hypothetical protein|nr:hypothetical protein [Acidimicrobiales bacterium]